MVDSEAALHAEVSPEQVRELDDRLAGRRVITESGQSLGEIFGFRVHDTIGRIETYRIHPTRVGLAKLAALIKHDEVEFLDSVVVTLGADALVVRDKAIALFHPDSPSPDERDSPEPETR
jgi:hypothetical protein